MTANERQLVVGWAFAVPLQVMLDLRRLAVFVSAEDADVEVEPGILEVIGIAAVKRDLLFRSKDQANVVITLVAVKVELAALIKGHHIRTQPGFFFALFFD